MKTSATPHMLPSSGKRSSHYFGLGTYLGLAGALFAMIALFSVLSDHFLS